MKRSAGFTLIELVVVIVLLGILAAVAVPKFVNLSDNARDTAALSVAGSISSGSAVNFGQYSAKGGAAASGAPYAITGTAAQVCTAATLQNFVTGVALLDGATAATGNNNTNFKIGASATSAACAGGGSTVTCTVTAWGTNA